MSVTREPVGPGQESVWDYPRPPRAEATRRHLLIRHRGATLAESDAPVRTLETSHPPSWYVASADVDQTRLRPSARTSFCEWKGHAVYFDVVLDGEVLEEVAWSYPDPSPAFALLKGRLAFYAAPFELCSLDGEKVAPQPGGFYGGWITKDLAGPFKGIPGSRFW